MRQRRLLAPADHPVAYYHCISRVVNRQFVFGDLEKKQFILFLREYEVFCGIRIITYCVMSNHFHILVEVPKRPQTPLPDDELFRRMDALTGLPGRANSSAQETIRRLRAQGDDTGAELLREKYLSRMWDLSYFMKVLKQRFSQWFNQSRGRKGTLWEERFKSVLIEGAGMVLAATAAYIDLNPVRAGLVKDPGDYRWCGYTEALVGKEKAREALRVVIAGAQRVGLESVNWREALEGYRVLLHRKGQEQGLSEMGEALKGGLGKEAAEKLAKGKVSVGEYVTVKVRYFTDGAVLGSREFVEGVFRSLRARFSAKRKDGARKMKGVESEELYALRNLRLRVREREGNAGAGIGA